MLARLVQRRANVAVGVGKGVTHAQTPAEAAVAVAQGRPALLRGCPLPGGDLRQWIPPTATVRVTPCASTDGSRVFGAANGRTLGSSSYLVAPLSSDPEEWYCVS